ncbi:GPI inositol deacylase [Massospora cicadina]|nr:GPI inositol deacylase [Massospora cicadina]
MAWLKTISAPSLLLATFTLVTFVSVYKVSRDRVQAEVGGCRMTYSAPNYLLMASLPVTDRGYRLFLFRDAQYDVGKRALNVLPSSAYIRFEILFLHGNAGSYKQVRSLAKVSSERAYESLGPGLDFFAADFQEEFSALTGELLLKQAEYVNQCIAHILSLYEKSRTEAPLPTSVLVIGHSMGGVVARAAIGLSSYVPKSINTMITLSTPHTDAPVPLERSMWDFYRGMNGFWVEHFASEGKLSRLEDVSVISINGGEMDGQIAADLTDLTTLVPKEHGFMVFSTTLPKAWVSVEHQVILWCNQVVESIVGALQAVVRRNATSRTLALSERMEVFSHHFLETPTPSSSVVVLTSSYAKEAPGYLAVSEMARDVGISLKEGLVVTSSIPIEVYTCDEVEGGLRCLDISSRRILLPASDRRADPEFGTAVFYFWEVPPADSILCIKKPRSSSKEDFIQTSHLSAAEDLAPSLLDLVLGFWHDLPSDSFSHWQFRLPDSPLLAYTLNIESPTQFILHQANLFVNERKVWVSTTNGSPIYINFHARPEGQPLATPFWQGVQFRLWPSLPAGLPMGGPNVPIRMRFRLDGYGTLLQLLRRIGMAAVAFPYAAFLFVFRIQLLRFSRAGVFPSFLNAFDSFAKGELKYWVAIGGLLPWAQHAWNSPALNLPWRSRNWLLGAWGSAVIWGFPLTMVLAVGWLGFLYAPLQGLKFLLCPLSRVPVGGLVQARWLLALLLLLPHPLTHAITFLILTAQLASATSTPRLNLRFALALLLLCTLPCHLPWLIVSFQSLARGLKPDLTLQLSQLRSIPLVLIVTLPMPLSALQTALARPSVALATQSITLAASLAALLWGCAPLLSSPISRVRY